MFILKGGNLIKRIIEISKDRCFLSVRLGQLIIKRDGQPNSSIPIEDIGVLLISHKAVTYTHSVMIELLSNNSAIILCGDEHLPCGMFLPISSNATQTEKFRHQINAKLPLKKRLWQQLVKAKIRHQAKVVEDYKDISRALKLMAKKVKSGDPENLEAQASRKYWPVFIQDNLFKRDMNGAPPNNLLNYGYMVLRAAVARAICSAGLLPTLGIHHRNRYNAYCLADDIVEPFRGFIDKKVKEICEYKSDLTELDQQTKAELISVLYDKVKIGVFSGPLMVGLHRTAASLARCYAGKQKKLELPKN